MEWMSLRTDNKFWMLRLGYNVAYGALIIKYEGNVIVIM